MADSRLIDASNDILDNIAAELTNRGIDVPSRQYVHVGQIVDDLVLEKCADQLVVSWQGTTPGAVEVAGGAAAFIRCAMPFTYQFEVRLSRCVPTFKMNAAQMGYTPPTVADMGASASEIQTDAATLIDVIVTLVLGNDLIGQNIDVVGMGLVLPIGPQGGAGGTSVSFFATLL